MEQGASASNNHRGQITSRLLGRRFIVSGLYADSDDLDKAEERIDEVTAWALHASENVATYSLEEMHELCHFAIGEPKKLYTQRHNWVLLTNILKTRAA